MSWTIGQVVAIERGAMPDDGYERQIVEAVYRDGSCRTEDGLRWTKNGEQWGAVRFGCGALKAITDDFLFREDQERSNNEENRKSKTLRKKREEIISALNSITDATLLERAHKILLGHDL